LGIAADGRATCHRFFIGNSPARQSEVNTIFCEVVLEAIDRTPLYFQVDEKPRIPFCSAARNRAK
jgi:hypothetical protein